MAISQGQCTSFKVGLFNGQFNFGTGTPQVFKIALYASTADLGASTTAYTPVGEVVGAGYSAGGQILTPIPPASSGTTAYISFSNVSWPLSTITARGALIYLADGVTNPAVAVLDFGADKTTVANTFTIEFPAATSSAAIIRIT